MANPESPIQFFSNLRKLAAENPRQARIQLLSLLDSDAATIEEVLRLAGAPGEGRLRQLIANAVRQRSDKPRLVPHLRRWLATETDEFSKAAINGALVGVDQTALEVNT